MQSLRVAKLLSFLVASFNTAFFWLFTVDNLPNINLYFEANSLFES